MTALMKISKIFVLYNNLDKYLERRIKYILLILLCYTQRTCFVSKLLVILPCVFYCLGNIEKKMIVVIFPPGTTLYPSWPAKPQ